MYITAESPVQLLNRPSYLLLVHRQSSRCQFVKVHGKLNEMMVF